MELDYQFDSDFLSHVDLQANLSPWERGAEALVVWGVMQIPVGGGREVLELREPEGDLRVSTVVVGKKDLQVLYRNDGLGVSGAVPLTVGRGERLGAVVGTLPVLGEFPDLGADEEWLAAAGRRGGEKMVVSPGQVVVYDAEGELVGHPADFKALTQMRGGDLHVRIPMLTNAELRHRRMRQVYGK